MTLAASTASAAIVTATYVGKVTGTRLSGDTDGAFDNAGVFGAARNLDGVDFTAVFTFNTNLGARFTQLDYDQLVGGAFFGLDSPFLSAILTIERVDFAFGSDLLAVALVVTNGLDSATLHQVSNGFNFLTAGLQNPLLPLNLTGPFSGDDFADDPDNLLLGEFLVSEGDDTVAHGYLAASHLTISSAPVPEPATWGLMLLGFGSLGLMARRARRAGLLPIA